MKSFTFCPNSGVAVAPHTVCLKSGYYKGVKVMDTKADRAVRRAEKHQKAEMRATSQAAQKSPEIVESAVKKAVENKETN
jgi:uncharacterized protein (UPF0218 family)